ncbi:Acyltransferase [Rhodovastum atsumiense]|uniref:Acyltransferase n=1 Tax=Rhodovastum atsumiense TaxID=504468 RepID=A0A5M6J1V0_9PROT|nr:acyltransferase [Rhodovastum atsumiense]KAA5614047.1 acyltransferase [Rhodovastum atsumiense]CAH2598861.1 Acyltransferase [Rhodovastum atsumiense]
MNRSAVSGRSQNKFGFLRVLFAILVILSHSPELLDGNRSREILTRLFGTISIGELAVDGFFLISGYLITASWETSRTTGQYLLKRVLRIYPGFIVAFLISLLVVGPLAGGDLASLLGRPGLRQFARMLLLGEPQLQGAFVDLPYPALNGSMWTVIYEFRFYLATMALGILGIIRHRHVYLGMTLLLMVIWVAVPHLRIGLPGAVEMVAGEVHHSIRLFALFCCGGLFYLFRDKILYDGRLAGLAAVTTCCLLFSSRLAEPGLAVFGGYVLFWVSFHARPNLLSGIDNRIDLSYGLYLYAWPVQNLLIAQTHDISPWVLFAISSALAALLGTASWVLVENPFLRLKGRGRVYQATSVPAAAD